MSQKNAATTNAKISTDSYYNTTNEDVQLCIEYERKAQEQEALVLNCFSGNTMRSPYQIYCELVALRKIKSNTPLTPIRRAMTNLTKRRLLRKTIYKVTGAWGRAECLWELVNQEA